MSSDLTRCKYGSERGLDDIRIYWSGSLEYRYRVIGATSAAGDKELSRVKAIRLKEGVLDALDECMGGPRVRADINTQ